MNDVMSSLHTMSLSRTSSPGLDDGSQTPPNVWSPEAFDMIHQKPTRKTRPRTSLGLNGGHGDDDYEDDNNYPDNPDSFGSQEHDTRVASYVERMESRLKRLHEQGYQDMGPTPPPKNGTFRHMRSRTQGNIASALTEETPSLNRKPSRRKSLRHRRSAVELGKEVLGRTFTTKTNSTQHSSSTNATDSTSHTLMSGTSAGGFSATSAGSLARRKFGLGSQRARPLSAFGTRADVKQAFGLDSPAASESQFSGGISYHSSHDSGQGFTADPAPESASVLGGFAAPKPKKSGFFKKMLDSAKTNAKTGAATARSSISNAGSRPSSRSRSRLGNGVQSISGGSMGPGISSAAQDMGLGNTSDWIQVRRDINRSNSLSKNERIERAERCAMMDFPVLNSVDLLFESAQGNEAIDGRPVHEPVDFTQVNLSLVDKSARFVQGIPPMTTAASLAQGYVARPYRSEIQRLRAIFTWVSERIAWEEDFEGEIDTRRVIQAKRGCPQEVALLVAEMCSAVGIHSEVVRGYLKTPGETIDFDMAARPNHWWTAVIADGEWRIMDCSLASPSHPKRILYSSVSSQAADSWLFLTRPMDVCFTHVPLLPEQQHIVPPVSHDILMALPCACPPYFKHQLHLADFDTSLCNLDGLEMAHLHVMVPEDVECVAEVETHALAQDADGDYFESGEVVRKRALSQPEWVAGQKRYTIKALLPGDEGQGVLRVYAGKRGLMVSSATKPSLLNYDLPFLQHSIKSNPHALAFALPLVQSGQNPPYNFLRLHPTPHAQRHDLYIAQPQCHRLAINNTFVFSVRQHPSCTYSGVANSVAGRSSPNPYANPGAGITRPTSAMSMASTSQAGSTFSAAPSSSSASTAPSVSSNAQKPAKLAIQSPAGKIIRLMRRSDYRTSEGTEGGADGSTWETVVKIGERGVWRGLVLADRSARWCVFAEWECV
jgi:bifunctional glutamyl/prolyl-tRNA synthetase